MINKDKVVPIQRSDLLTMYGTILALATRITDKIHAEDGAVSITADASGLCDAPVKTMTIADGLSEAEIYFVADFDFEKIEINSEEFDVGEIQKDAATLYRLLLDHSEWELSAVSPVA